MCAVFFSLRWVILARGVNSLGWSATVVTAHSQICTLEPDRSGERWVQPGPEWAPQWELLSLHGFHPVLGEEVGWRLAYWIHCWHLSGLAGCAVQHNAACGWEGDWCWGLQMTRVLLLLWPEMPLPVKEDDNKRIREIKSIIGMAATLHCECTKLPDNHFGY